MRATIDGHAIDFEPGETVLHAAQRSGVEIPNLCFDPRMSPEGGCRICLVELANSETIAAACHTPLNDGDVVTTDSVRVQRLRSGALSLIVDRLPKSSVEASERGTPLGRIMAKVGVRTDAAPAESSNPPFIDQSHPYLRYVPDHCIVCRRCVHACESIQGQFVYGMAGRGAATHLIFGPGVRFADSDCTACGACVDACPTGAITDRDRLTAAPAERIVRTTCGYCGVGCQMEVATARELVMSIRGYPSAEVNRGHLCAKGRYAHAYLRASDRLTMPLMRKGGRFEEVSWDTAYEFAATRLAALRDTHGPDALGGLASSRSTNEAAYLLQKFFRRVIGTNNIDCCARVCHSSTAFALQTVTGTGAATASYADIERAKCIFVAGANPTEAHPVVGARIKQAALRGVPLIVADPRNIELASFARVHLPLQPGTNVLLFNALAKILIERDAIDHNYIESRTEGFAELEQFLRTISLSQLLDESRITAETVQRAAQLLAESGPVLFVHGLGLSELTQGTESVMALCNLGMLTGSIGRPGAGMLPLRGQNNVQGAADMGAAPAFLTGYQPINDATVRAHFAALWGAEPPSTPGLTTTEMLDAANEGRIRALWVQGEDLAHSDPYQSRTIRALENLDLLIVQDPFFNESARYAHLVLPATTTLENDGTYTNGERRVQRVNPAVRPPGEVRQDWNITRDIANVMGANWRYDSPMEVMREIARSAPRLFGGVAYERLCDNGIQWPCPDSAHPGTATVHSEAFLRGKGRLMCIEYSPGPEQATNEYPFVLITGRVLHQYNVATMTQRTPQSELAPTDFLEMNDTDAKRLDIASGTTVRVESRWGATDVIARISERVRPGTLFLSFHHPESGTNRLIGPHVDPYSKCPDYKVTAVRVSKPETPND